MNNRVRELRNERGWSQAEFSRLGHISTSMTSQFLRGSRGGGEVIYRAASEALGVPLSEVYRLAGILPATNGNGRHYDSESELILQRLGELTPEQRREVLSFVESVKVRDAKRTG